MASVSLAAALLCTRLSCHVSAPGLTMLPAATQILLFPTGQACGGGGTPAAPPLPLPEGPAGSLQALTSMATSFLSSSDPFSPHIPLFPLTTHLPLSNWELWQ